MHTKLDIEITISDLKLSGNGILNDETIKSVYIKFNDVDERFQLFNCMTKHQIFIGSNGMKILCSNDAPMGRLYHEIVFVPYTSNLGNEVSLSFFDDDSRKQYLKKLYDTLLNWANNWWGFDKDTPSKISVVGNRWIVFCDYKDLYKYQDCEVY